MDVTIFESNKRTENPAVRRFVVKGIGGLTDSAVFRAMKAKGIPAVGSMRKVGPEPWKCVCLNARPLGHEAIAVDAEYVRVSYAEFDEYERSLARPVTA